jgi:hypothetical protein
MRVENLIILRVLAELSGWNFCRAATFFSLGLASARKRHDFDFHHSDRRSDSAADRRAADMAV